MTKEFNTLLTYLNNNKKVFVEEYEQHMLTEITLDNIHLYKTVDISDEMIDDENMTHDNKIEYYSQDFNQSYNRDVLTEQQIDKCERHAQQMRDFLSQVSVSKIYHVDCEADVYIID